MISDWAPALRDATPAPFAGPCGMWTYRVPDLAGCSGEAHAFQTNRLKAALLEQAYAAAAIPLTPRMQPGYDHSHYLISSFRKDHIR
jgi:S-formylglutathione hydrolase FrmB